MAMSSKDIEAALSSCKDPGSFNHKAFFSKVGLSSKDIDHVSQVLAILDQDKSEFTDEDELKLFLQNFASANVLTDKETKEFPQAELQSLVKS